MAAEFVRETRRSGGPAHFADTIQAREDAMFLPLGFDKAVALECAALVNQAYDQYEQFLKNAPWKLSGSYDTLGLLFAKPGILFAHKEPFGFVARNQTSGNVFVTFRGTKSLEDWLSDFTFPLVAHPWGQAEEGFSDLYAQCTADVLAFVKSAGSARSVFATGHSLGAALAVLAVADLVNSGVAPGAAMYSFAGPRVGDPPFAAEFNKRIVVRWRIANTEDIVTTLPVASTSLFGGGIPHTKLRVLLALARAFNYEHVGFPASFTTHHGTIPANHAMQTYIDALNAS
jgi:triacylglycerol lipase